MSGSKRIVKLFCPTVAKVVQLVAHDEQRLDLGSIARTFGLDPATLKLNGHFISRGVDLIASSVTWKSLITFFSSRGLSTGTDSSGALVVDGKLSKSSSKREIDSRNWGHDEMNRESQLEEPSSSKKTKFKDFDVDRGSGKPLLSNPFSLKRKQEDDICSPKKLKVEDSRRCSFLGVNMKRMREDDLVLPSICKKTRQYQDLNCK